MSIENNKTLVRRHYEEVLTGRNPDLVDDLYLPMIGLSDGNSIEREQFKGYLQISLDAFPDLVVTVEDQIAEGDKVVTRWTAEGTHRGSFFGLEATGKQVRLQAIHIHQIKNGKIARLWEEFDMFGLRQQLGFT
ncbi:MAG: ester cyclase [Ardenticatenaceae bacterium]|nr:ester cyclase [Ardenticatenaceae bacterium]